MKAAPFEYSRPVDVEEACVLLASDENARVIAGGQSLVPMMAMRLARPTRLVDIARITALSGVRAEGNGVTIGATTRQCVIERDALVASKVPLLARAIPCIGHTATRARGTIGGSLAHADPSAELPLIAVTLEAILHYHTTEEAGELAAAEFFLGPTITSLPAGACLTAAHFPVWSGKVGTAFHEVNARQGDFAFVSAAAQLEIDDAGRCKRIAIGIGAATDVPLRLESAEQQLIGTMLAEPEINEALRAALTDIEPTADLHASAEYRRRVALSLALRAITEAKTNAQGSSHAH